MKNIYIKPIVDTVPYNSATIMSGSLINMGGSNLDEGAPKVAESKFDIENIEIEADIDL